MAKYWKSKYTEKVYEVYTADEKTTLKRKIGSLNDYAKSYQEAYTNHPSWANIE